MVMEVLLAALVVALLLGQFALWLLLRTALQGGSLTLRIQHQQVAPVLSPPEQDAALPSSAEIPDRVVEFCAAESEPWAQEAQLRRARVLYAESAADRAPAARWDYVLSQLQQTDPRVE